MRRRTFLRLSSAALASLGLSACGAKPTSSSTTQEPSSKMDTDIIDASDEFEDIGLTLEEATNSSQQFYIHRSDKFYPLFSPTYYGTSISPQHTFYRDISTALIIDNITYQASYPYGEKYKNPLTDNITLFDGDELVYISTNSIPDYVDLMPVTGVVATLPVIFECDNPYRNFCTADEVLRISALPHREFSDYDPSYIPADDHSIDCLSVRSLSNLTINGLSVQDYCDTHDMVLIYQTEEDSAFDNSVKSYNYHYIVNLSEFSELDSEKRKNGIRALVEENDQNTVTISYYEGTQYHSFTLQSTCLAYTYTPSQAMPFPVSLTQNGYAVIDTSDTPSNGYAVGFYSSPEEHALTTTYHFISIGQY